MALKVSALIGLLTAVVSANPQPKLAATRGAATTCAVETTAIYGLESPLPNPEDWYASMNEKYATATQFTGENVEIHTIAMSENGAAVMTGFHVLPSDLLEAEGIEVTSSLVTTTSCGAPKETGPPEEVCDPHGDHWHCPEGVDEPENPPTDEQLDEAGETVPEECVPHGDHWHCPEGVDEPAFPPTQDDFEDDGEGPTECVAHEEHWHCPPGMAEPTYAPRTEESAAGSSQAILGLVMAIIATLAI